jgi:hypothetical protein
VNINAQWSEQSTTATFAGQLSSWNKPLGLTWLSFQVRLFIARAHTMQS